MSKEIAIKQADLQAMAGDAENGTNNVNVTNQNGGTVNFNYNINYPQTADASAETMIAIQSFSKEYYQLIVTSEEDVFSTGVVSVISNSSFDKI